MRLLVLHSENASLIGRSLVLDPQQPLITIGRDARSTLVVESPAVSRVHARITWSDNTWWITDAGSTHGVRVGDARVERAELKPETRFWIGDTLFLATLRPWIVETEWQPNAPDGLTGLLTLATLRNALETMLQRDPRPLSLAHFDIDNLRAWNDKAGHVAVDALLTDLATRLRDAVGPEAIVARVGGDDFVVALPGLETYAARAHAAELRAKVLARPFALVDETTHPSLSVGVACGPRTPDALLRAAADDLASRKRRASSMPGAPLVWASGLWTSADVCDVAAGAADDHTRGESVLVVSDGMGGHATGWLGARFAVRACLEGFGANVDAACLEGHADLIPEQWGWASMLSRADGEAIYARCVAALHEAGYTHSDDARAVFSAIDGVLATVPKQARISGLLAGCTSLRIAGRHLRGAHVGYGQARLLRANAAAFEELVVPHYLHTVAHRLPSLAGIDPSTLPLNIVCNGLGHLAASGVGVDLFEADLAPGDRLLLASGPIDLPNETLVALLRTDRPRWEQARALERHLDEALATGAHAWVHEIAFLIVHG